MLQQKSRRAFDILLEQIRKTRDAKSHRVPMEFFLDTVPAPKRNIIGLKAYGTMLREHQAKLEEIIRALDLEVASLRSENALLREENASLKESRSFRPGERLLAALRKAFRS